VSGMEVVYAGQDGCEWVYRRLGESKIALTRVQWVRMADLLGWPLALRLVCTQWRRWFDEAAPARSKLVRVDDGICVNVPEALAWLAKRRAELRLPGWAGLSMSVTGDAEGYSLLGDEAAGLYSLSLSGTGVTDVSALGGLKALFFNGCTGVTDVSALGGIDTLLLKGCTGVTDVSALGGLKNIWFCGCTGVTDVSALGGLETLWLVGCTGVTDVSALGGIDTLFLHGCTGVTDVSALGGLKTLYLNGCTGVTDVSALGGLVALYLNGCTGVTDVSALNKVKRLWLPSGELIERD
jgi:hypothetical protein